MATSFSAAAGSISNRGAASALNAAAIATLLPTASFTASSASAFSLGSGSTARPFLVLSEAAPASRPAATR